MKLSTQQQQQEQDDDDAVRELAARLAPSLEQADALLANTVDAMMLQRSSSIVTDDDDDDSIDQEMHDLQQAEELLQRELAMIVQSPLVDDDTSESVHTPSSSSSSSTTLFWTTSESSSSSSSGKTQYHHEDHMEYLQLSKSYLVHRTLHLSPTTTSTTRVVHEFVISPSQDTLKQMFVGLQSTTTDNLPIRTIMIRIRPDVLCGAVMEALQTALLDKQNNKKNHNNTTEMDKRQGGHIQATWCGYRVDLQLVTAHVSLERTLLMRLFYTNHSEVLPPLSKETSEEELLVDNIQYLIEHGLYLDDDNDNETTVLVSTKDRPSLHLRECAALIQRMETPPSSRKSIRFTSYPLKKQSMQQAVSEHLLEHYIACPSVKEGTTTLPALNAQDYAVLQKSWSLVETIWNELETRDLVYSALQQVPFGTFPALPTLDVHYCAQLRRVSREQMIQQLLKGASELEEFAREAEYACANMIALLKPTFQAYGIPETPLPQPVALADYSIDFTPPQVACPPWGLSVQSALSQIQSWVDVDHESSFEKADNAVNLVFHALQMQDDEEQTARLDRKNRQVMDRLASMQAHEKAMIDDIEAEPTVKAIAAANDFEAIAKVRQVPLVTWSFVSGTTGTGTCTVTSHYILFSTRRIPVIGGTTTELFALQDVEFEVLAEQTSMLNPFSSSIRVLNRQREEVFRFRPSMGAARLKSFLDRLKINPFLEAP